MADYEFSDKELLKLADDLEKMSEAVPKLTKRFLNKEGNKLKSAVKKLAKTRIKVNSGNYMKHLKRGKPYQYKGVDWSVRVYNASNHAHLIEDGHDIVAKGSKRGKGKKVGYKNGYHIHADAERRFTNTYVKDAMDFLDEVLDEGKW
ncbi:HK97 gp10 family phage protein [Acidaminobacter sp. JC074]|uniref:HK97 gp10 family phage protein n=1 Tax=Acidaminobacter sp. JC074 TaxID=2530199 RepID=UPI001F1089AA|nr:HK97 gp10 family phage protein [Acidaminobacter sp. JC074]MCH4891183.1 HK97 gp10 family phage protein [Acidaminobacter sp. JC074]